MHAFTAIFIFLLVSVYASAQPKTAVAFTPSTPITLAIEDSDASTDLHLLSVTGQNTSFNRVLADNKGRVIYVDFWASWCGPCIHAMPASKKLRTSFTNRGISFVFLSMDESNAYWIKSAQEHSLINSTSFMVNSRYGTAMLDELHIREIPRYLIYDKKGNLVNKNAPSPGSPDLTALLEKYLKE